METHDRRRGIHLGFGREDPVEKHPPAVAQEPESGFVPPRSKS